jgi:hypothetical protein
MMLFKNNKNILKFIDAYDFNKKLWIFLELMDIGALSFIILDR